MYLPGFPAMAKDFGTDVAAVGFSLTSFFIGISAGQLLYGPLLDRFGRKRPLFIGLALYILASIGCMYAHTINTLIIVRFIQAIGSCAATVAAMAMVRDLFPVKDNAKVFSLLLLVVGASPMIAPTVGGYVTSAFGWASVFLILTIMGAVLLLSCILWLPESYEPDTMMSLKPKPIINNFLSVVREPQFYTYAFTGGVAFSSLLAYVSGSPQVFMKIYHVNDKTYGWIFALLAMGFIGSSQVNSLLLRRFRSQDIIPVALCGQLLFGVLMVLGTMNNIIGMYGLIALLFLYLCCLGLVNPNAAALSLAPFERNAGSASALMGALQLGLGALTSAFVSYFDTPTALPLSATMAGSALLATLILFTGRRNIRGAVTQSSAAAGVLH